jgi:hypothetical protein
MPSHKGKRAGSPPNPNPPDPDDDGP